MSVIIDDKRYTWRRPVCGTGDYSNRALLNPSYADINTAQMLCLVKALAMAGLGLNLYYGEDFEEKNDSHQNENNVEPESQVAPADRDQINASPMPAGNTLPHPAPTKPVQSGNIDDVLTTGKRTLFKRNNGQPISATDLLLRAYAERQSAKANGGQVGECCELYRKIAKDKNYQELFKRLSNALGLKAC